MDFTPDFEWSLQNFREKNSLILFSSSLFRKQESMFDQKFHRNVSEIAIFLEYENPQILFYRPFFRFIGIWQKNKAAWNEK